jgi:hypothetical protein
MLLVLIFLSVLQSSALMARLLIIPTSLFVIKMMEMELSSSGLVLLIYILVFIGGLLVFLVRLTSTLSLEQWPKPRGYVLLLRRSALLSTIFLFP